MNDSAPHSEDDMSNATREEILAALFANMVIQQTNMAMMLLGKVAHPETGKIVRDLEAARMFIDQLEMLEVKTKGNLSKQEDGLMKQALAALHMAFVEAVETDGPKADDALVDRIVGSKSESTPESPAQPVEKPAAQPSAGNASPAAAAEDSRKKFSKKY